ncbi:MAG TPA: hypothetical protein VHS97_08760, partial [Isosphaeraceae bacterium]|nr:hypothetical protein [Isosphaeraceae bacterium]
QATAGGCQWMLDRWSELRSILEEGLDWQSADKLKAVRLLGRHPIEAVDDRNALMVFVACQSVESRTSIQIPDIWNELRKYERKQYAERLIGRGVEKLRPTDTAAARQVLYAIIDRATAQIALKAEAHRARAEIDERTRLLAWNASIDDNEYFRPRVGLNRLRLCFTRWRHLLFPDVGRKVPCRRHLRFPSLAWAARKTWSIASGCLGSLARTGTRSYPILSSPTW